MGLGSGIIEITNMLNMTLIGITHEFHKGHIPWSIVVESQKIARLMLENDTNINWNKVQEIKRKLIN